MHCRFFRISFHSQSPCHGSKNCAEPLVPRRASSKEDQPKVASVSYPRRNHRRIDQSRRIEEHASRHSHGEARASSLEETAVTWANRALLTYNTICSSLYSGARRFTGILSPNYVRLSGWGVKRRPETGYAIDTKQLCGSLPSGTNRVFICYSCVISLNFIRMTYHLYANSIFWKKDMREKYFP